MGTNVWPNEPVPPVSRTDLPVSIGSRSLSRQEKGVQPARACSLFGVGTYRAHSRPLSHSHLCRVDVETRRKLQALRSMRHPRHGPPRWPARRISRRARVTFEAFSDRFRSVVQVL